jgi:SAM-dependent methyltransferase
MQHQTHTTTEFNRYPDIFEYISINYPKINKILSFGCSSGEECFTLKEKYFKESNIIGVDLNLEILEKAKDNNKYNDICFYNSINDINEVDCIFAMSVFCKWPESDGLDHNHIYSFAEFNKAINLLDNKLKPGGIFVIYNSNYYFQDTEISVKYNPIIFDLRKEFVRKFDKNHKYCQTESPIIFIKKKIS